MKALIFAAGLGTRLKPLTDSVPKALVSIAGKPLLEHVIIKLMAAGCTKIMINVHHFPDQIIDFLHSKNNFGIEISISDERECLLDTGGAVRKAASFFDDGQAFLVHNVDILSNVDILDLYQYHLQNNALGTLVVSQRHTFRYLLFDKEQMLKGWVNEKTYATKPEGFVLNNSYNKYAFSGIQVLSPKVFDLMENFGDVFSIMDFYLSMVDSQTIKAYVPKNYRMIDVGKLDVIDQAEAFVRESEQ